MEHEVFVPVPVPALRRTLADPARVARCVPGFQQDADSSAGPLAGRLKFRAGGHTITYRGALALRPSEGGDSFSVSGEGAEARGGGSAKLALTIGLTRTDGGTTIGYSGTVRGEGRIVDLDVSTALTAAQRLLDRFTQQLVTEALSARSDEPVRDASVPDAPESGAQEPGKPESDAPEPGKPEPAAGEHASDAPSPDAPDEPQGSGPAEPSADKESVFDSPVPPPSLDPSAELEFTVPDEPPAEAAHARRRDSWVTTAEDPQVPWPRT
uniref:SRPBCC domain-containing protein n=1 Tax=Streptomyces sp. rh45 TaxID=3028726 RepID=UPI003C7CF8C0